MDGGGQGKGAGGASRSCWRRPGWGARAAAGGDGWRGGQGARAAAGGDGERGGAGGDGGAGGGGGRRQRARSAAVGAAGARGGQGLGHGAVGRSFFGPRGVCHVLDQGHTANIASLQCAASSGTRQTLNNILCINPTNFFFTNILT